MAQGEPGDEKTGSTVDAAGSRDGLAKEANVRGDSKRTDGGKELEPLEVPGSRRKLSHEEGEVDGDDSSSFENDSEDATVAATAQPASQVPSRMSSYISPGVDIPVETERWTSTYEVPDSVYDRFPKTKKIRIVSVLSFCSFLAPISSTAVLAAVPEVAAEYNTTGIIVNLSNSLYILTMGLSPLFWSPLSQVYGRRVVYLVTLFLFFGCSLGTAMAPNLAAFFVFRILSAFEGTAFILVGTTIIGDMYRPTERGTALSWFLLGTLVGPALGPFIGGLITNFQSWRVIFWLQTALAGCGFVALAWMLPETAHQLKITELAGLSRSRQAGEICSMINPVRVLRLFVYPNLQLAAIASSALLFNMYSLLTPIRYVLNQRFGLTSPLLSGLFYLAPGFGYMLGTTPGGWYSDYTLRRWIAKRGGVRVHEDRLLAAVPFAGIIIPVCTLLYGWGVEKEIGGIPLVIITLFVQGVAQLFCFPSINAYCLDVMQSHSAEVVGGNYVIRYMFAAMGTVVVLPAIESIGVGWFSTVSALFLAVSALGLLATTRWGPSWRNKRDRKRRAKRKKRAASERETAEDGGETAANVVDPLPGDSRGVLDAPADREAQEEKGKRRRAD